ARCAAGRRAFAVSGAGLQRRACVVHRTRNMIETERLVIRPLTDDDRPEMLAHWMDPANERATPDATEEQIHAWAMGVPWGVWERETGELIGDCNLHFDKGFGEWELSYGFRRDRWGRGY